MEKGSVEISRLYIGFDMEETRKTMKYSVTEDGREVRNLRQNIANKSQERYTLNWLVDVVFQWYYAVYVGKDYTPYTSRHDITFQNTCLFIICAVESTNFALNLSARSATCTIFLRGLMRLRVVTLTVRTCACRKPRTTEHIIILLAATSNGEERRRYNYVPLKNSMLLTWYGKHCRVFSRNKTYNLVIFDISL